MAKKKNITASKIISHYMEYVLENDKKPSSVYTFAKSYNFPDNEFYKYFGSFDRLEEEIFKLFFTNTITLIKKDTNYNDYGSRHQLLTFYFSFFELLTMNRSYVLYTLEQNKSKLKKLKMLVPLKKEFSNYIENLNFSLIETKQKKFDEIQRSALKESAWIQLLFTIKYWIEDTSPSFEKTDIFIEKTVNTSFDLLNIKPVNSLIDLGKFLYKDLANRN